MSAIGVCVRACVRVCVRGKGVKVDDNSRGPERERAMKLEYLIYRR